MLTSSLKKKIIDALWSGKYKQGCGQLYVPSEDCYCVMGVVAKETGMKFSPIGTDVVGEDGKGLDYKPLYDLFEGEEKGYDVVWRFIRMNDSGLAPMSFKDFAIEFEKLPTVD